MELASQNLPSAGVGYEIFDKSDAFGTTAFVQNINRLRALEGELARSIETIDNIDSARVHLVIPERQIFSRQTQPPTASVVLKARSNAGPRPGRTPIQHLVAAAVAGLKSGRVAIVDDHGNLLAGGDGQGRPGRQRRRRRTSTPPTTKTACASASRISSPASSAPAMSASRSPPTSSTTTSSRPRRPTIRTARSCVRPRPSNSSANDTTGGSEQRLRRQRPARKARQTTPGDKSQNKSSNSRNEETTNYEISKTVTHQHRGRRRGEAAFGRGGRRRQGERSAERQDEVHAAQQAGDDADRRIW